MIGSGPAGQRAAQQAATLDKRVALIERRQSLGGVCVHSGTIPSKAIREAVLHLTGMAGGYLHDRPVQRRLSMSELLNVAARVVHREVEVLSKRLATAGICMFFGDASFVSPHVVHVQDTEGNASDIFGERVLVAVGTTPARPDDVPFDGRTVIDSNELLLLPELPESMLILGGGVIGTEYACMMAGAGVKVTLLERRDNLLGFVDEQIGRKLEAHLIGLGVDLRLGVKVGPIRTDGKSATIIADGRATKADVLLYTLGRQGAVSGLDLHKAGLAPDDRGRLVVDEAFRTSVPHIYAAGDVIGFPALAATSVEQGRAAACSMFGCWTDRDAVPHADSKPIFPFGVYTIPEISMIGPTEQQLVAAAQPFAVGCCNYSQTARGHLLGDNDGFLKLLFHPQSRRLLAVHAIGTQACELVHLGQAVMAANFPVDYFIDSIFNYPTLAETYKLAAEDGIRKLAA